MKSRNLYATLELMRVAHRTRENVRRLMELRMLGTRAAGRGGHPCRPEWPAPY